MTQERSWDAAEVERNVELAVREWLGAMTVTEEVVRFTRDRFRSYFLNPARLNLPQVASLDDAIREARLRCPTWSPDEFLFFCWWLGRTFDWPATVPGWQAHLLDAVANDPAGLERSAVWVARVPWSSVLARFRSPNPLDEEWVVDTEHVKIKKFDDSPRRHHLPHCKMPARLTRSAVIAGPVRLDSRPDAGRCLECGAVIAGYSL